LFVHASLLFFSANIYKKKFSTELKPLTYFTLEQLHGLAEDSDVTDKLTTLAALQSLPASTEWVEAVEQVQNFFNCWTLPRETVTI
jgi:hypothetical protein